MSLLSDYQMILERQITEYKTVYGGFTSDLDDQVNKLIVEGWQPFGNQYSDGLFHCQVMVKRGNNEGESE